MVMMLLRFSLPRVRVARSSPDIPSVDLSGMGALLRIRFLPELPAYLAAIDNGAISTPRKIINRPALFFFIPHVTTINHDDRSPD